MTVQDRYLGLYRQYENLLRDDGKDPKSVEQELEVSNPGKAARLRMCRLFRNYMTHENDPGFLSQTDLMEEFLGAEITAMQTKLDVAKKHLRPPAQSIFDEKAKCSEIIEKVVKSKVGFFVRANVDGSYDILDAFAVMALYVGSKAAKLSVAKCLRMKPQFCGPTDLYSALDRGRIIICTSDGTPQGKPLGVVKFD